MSTELRDYQVVAIEELRDALRNKQRPMLSSPTGSGKGLIAAEIIRLARIRGKRIAYVVPLLSLINQAWRVMMDAGVDEREMGVLQASHPLTNTTAPVQIVSAQTVGRRDFPESDLVLIDEAHMWQESYGKWMEERPETIFVGMSATPWRRGLGNYFDRMVVATTAKELIARGYLAQYRAFGPASPDLSEVKTTAGDYNEGDLAKAMNKPELVADVVQTWLMLGERRKTFVFCVDCAHAYELSQQFIKAGIGAVEVSANTPLEDRDEMIRQLRDGLLDVICSVGTMGVGVDAPFVSCVVFARPTQSEMLFVQQAGRGLRLKPEGSPQDCLFLDHADNFARLGFPDEISHTTFSMTSEDEKKPRPERLPKKCPQCSYLKPVGVRECPSCGHIPTAPTKSCVEVAEGELVEIGGAKPKKSKPKPIEKREFYNQLLGYAKMLGKSESWALANFREKFGEWPHSKKNAIPCQPSPEVMSWVRSRQIAFAKRKSSAA